MIKLVVNKNDSNQSLINFIKKSFKNDSLSRIYYLFYNKKIRVNNKRVTDFKYNLQENDLIEIYDNTLTLTINQNQKINPQPEIDVIYEDEEILVVNKDHNILVHSVNDLSLDNMVRYYFQEHHPEILNQQTFVISHQYRLDKLTKGLVLYPKTKIAQQILVRAQNNNDFIKKYYAIVEGDFTQEINAKGFIYHDELQQKMVFTKKKTLAFAKDCQTFIKPIYHKNNLTLIECQLVTGRKHQIRATLSYFNCPIVGDYKYDAQILVKEKIMLFAYALSFKNLPEPLEYLNKQVFSLENIKQDLIKMINSNLFK